MIKYGSKEEEKRDNDTWLLQKIPIGGFLSIICAVEFWAVQMALGMVRVHYEPIGRCCSSAKVSQEGVTNVVRAKGDGE